MYDMLLYLINPIRVSLHLEEFNTRYGLLHIGISFENDYKLLRYDFKKDADTYLTYSKIKCIPLDYNNYNEDYIPETYDILKNSYSQNGDIKVMTIPLGVTNYTFDEIEQYEKQLHKKYRLGIYDCRHYVRRFTKWAVNSPTPVLKLKRLWKNNINNYQ